jgi:hypothetical protein
MAQQHRSYVDADGAVVIGRLRVGPKELGFGSAGEGRVLWIDWSSVNGLRYAKHNELHCQHKQAVAVMSATRLLEAG